VPIYIDTSALAKRYMHESASDEFDRFVAAADDALVLTPLIVTELASALRRRLRAGELDAAYLRRAEAAFDRDLRDAVWNMQPVEPGAFEAASRLIRELDAPLAALDAVHLASAIGFGCRAIATSDRQLARAARLCKLHVHDFSSPESQHA
jgi:predicted nucleic acid-binding protein